MTFGPTQENIAVQPQDPHDPQQYLTYPYPQPVQQVPPPQPLPQLPQQPGRAQRTWGWFRSQGCIVQGIIVVVILFCCGGGLAAAIAGGGDTSPGGSPTATTAAPPTSRPTATPNPNAGFQAYTDAVTADATIVSGDLSQLGTDCGKGDTIACSSDAQTVKDDATSFLADLKAHPAPPCLATVDKDLRAALGYYIKGSQEVIDGINNTDPSLVNQATADYMTGTKDLNNATTAIGAAHC